ncbi:hypothetical protein ABR763_01240 [Bacillus cereus]
MGNKQIEIDKVFYKAYCNYNPEDYMELYYTSVNSVNFEIFAKDSDTIELDVDGAKELIKQLQRFIDQEDSQND